MYGSNKLVVVSKLNDALPLVYRGHSGTVTGVSIAKSGCYAATGDNKGLLRIWALDHEDHRAKYTCTGLSGPIRDIGWDGEHKRVVFTGERAPNDPSGACSKAISWDTGNSLGTLGLHLKGRAATVSIKPNRPYRVVTAGKDDSTCLFHKGPPFARVLPENNVPNEKAHTKGAVQCVRYSNSGDYVVSVGSDKSVNLYEGKTLELQQRLENAHSMTVYGCAWSPDDSAILTASGDGTCTLWNVQEAKLVKSKTWKVAEHELGGTFDKMPAGGAQMGCGFVESAMMSVSLNGQISVLGDAGTVQTLTGHVAPISATCLLGDTMYSADTDGVVVEWNWKTLEAKRRITKDGNCDLMYVVHKGAASGVTGNENAVYSVGWDDQMYTIQDGKAGSPQALAGQPVATASNAAMACVLTVKGLQMVLLDGSIGDLIEIGYEGYCIEMDTKKVYVGGNDNKIHVYDIAGTTLQESSSLEGHRAAIHSLKLSNDGTKLASGDVKSVCVWDLSSGTALVGPNSWCFHTQRVTSLSWSPDDELLASGGADDQIYIWKPTKKMRRLAYNFCHRGGVVSLYWKENQQLVSAGVDSCVLLWDLQTDIQAKFG